MYVPDNHDAFEHHEREQERRNRRYKRIDRINKIVDTEIEEERLEDEKRIASKS